MIIVLLVCQKLLRETFVTKTIDSPYKWKTAAKICVFLNKTKEIA